MPQLPRLRGAPKLRRVTEVFAGYNHNARIAENEFYHTENLSTAAYPLLSTRPKRGELTGAFTNLRAILAKDALCWVDGGTLYVNGSATPLTGLQTQRETQLVSMGATVCVFPDAKYYNTLDPSDYGSMGASWTCTGAVSYRMCRADGTVYESVDKGASAPEDPENADVWIDTAAGAAKIWSAASERWTEIETVYTRVDFTTQGQLPAAFREYDGVEISGLYFDALNGSKILYAVGGSAETGAETPSVGSADSSPSGGANDYLVLVGVLEETYRQEGATVRIERQVPDMDFVCEAQNRLWGCCYGNKAGVGNVNELCCCALGDFRNWSQFLGLSTDSWRASCGSDGAWTGCVNYRGSPTFFKENRIHPVSVSSVGAHQVGDLPARGVQAGSHKSLAVVNETLYYKTRTGVAAWQGGIPADVGDALGDEKYADAAAGVTGQRYYLSMRDASNAWHLFCYDARTGLWMREDSLHVRCFTAWGDELYALSENKILALNGTAGTPEARVDWQAETGVLSYALSVSGRGSVPVRYVSRFGVRLRLQQGGKVKLYIEYDSDGTWVPAGEVQAPRLTTVTIPVRPRRCDHLRIKLTGEGEAKIYAISRTLERGSEM